MPSPSSRHPLPLRRGVYCALPCFFNDDESLDLEAFAKHIVYVTRNGCFPVISGSMGEAVHLTAEERVRLIRCGRDALDKAGLHGINLLVGCGAPSTRATIRLVREAAEAGADQAMVILDGYYAGLLKNNPQAMEDHFVEVAAASPIPIMLYNFPSVTNGIDLDHKLVEAVARRASNTCGIKLTCANVGKLTRLNAAIRTRNFDEQHPREFQDSPFLLLAGQIDILLASVPVGGDGCIGGVPNFAPLACSKLWELCQRPLIGPALQEAADLQAVIARADGLASSVGIPGMKWLLNSLFDYEKSPRRPLPTLSEDAGQAFLKSLEEILALETTLLAGSRETEAAE